MKIELKRDDAALTDIIVELKSGYYYDQSQWERDTKISLLSLVRFYERWSTLVYKMESMTAMKQAVNSIYGNLVELEKMIGETLE